MVEIDTFRRDLLSTLVVGIGTAVAGCSARETPPSTPNPETPTTRTSESTSLTTRSSVDPTTSVRTLSMGETATGSGGDSVTIASPRVEKIVFTPDVGTPVHPYPAGSPDSQFLVVSVSTGTTNLQSLSLTPVLDGRRQTSESYRLSFDTDTSGRLAFPVPVAGADSGAIEWRPGSDERYRWSLPESITTKLASSPQFEVREFTVPESSERGASFRADLTVANAGDRDGRFLGVVLDAGASSVPLVGRFTVDVPVGESVSRSLSGRPVRAETTATLDWGIGQMQRQVSVPV